MSTRGVLPALVALAFAGALLGYSRAAKAAVPSGSVLPPPTPTGIDTIDNVVTPTQTAELDIMARTVWGEARGEGYAGMQAVANVIMNRRKVSELTPYNKDWWGETITEICLAPKQFSAWLVGDPNRALAMAVTPADLQFRMAQEICIKAIGGFLPDLTYGAVNYHANYILPSWANPSRRTAAIGNHVFYA